MHAIDRLMETWTRGAARRTSRRSVLARLGGLIAGGAALPLLPVARASMAPSDAPVPEGAIDDPKRCEYWRHCAIDGFLCACCGGSATACPPGSAPSPITWIGTCRNPHDGRDYIISYNDCCGSASCGRCFCNRNERERPMYTPSLSNDVNWCSGSERGIAYVCSLAVVVGVAEDTA